MNDNDSKTWRCNSEKVTKDSGIRNSNLIKIVFVKNKFVLGPRNFADKLRRFQDILKRGTQNAKVISEKRHAKSESIS